jgi:hypothetical protein
MDIFNLALVAVATIFGFSIGDWVTDRTENKSRGWQAGILAFLIFMLACYALSFPPASPVAPVSTVSPEH